jgi:hypothetical protein
VLVAFALGTLLISVWGAVLVALWATRAFGISTILRALHDIADTPDADRPE